ncbi:MAG: 5'-3' exonuclease [Opitutales bacterium]
MKIFLLDSFNLIFRAYYGMPDLTRSDGLPTGMLHGWVRTLWSLEDQFQPDQMIAVMDSGADDREELHADYKANRGETPEAITQQLPWLEKLTERIGIPLVEFSGAEADDVIGVLAHAYQSRGDEVVIVSADKDLGQLVKEGIRQLYPPPTANPRLGWRMMDTEAVEKKFAVRPDQIADYLALIGDTSDNIDGIPGVGPKTAAKWLNSYGNLENIIQNSGRLKPPRFQQIVADSVELLKRNQRLTRLNLGLDVEIPEPMSVDVLAASSILEELEMKKAARDLAARIK